LKNSTLVDSATLPWRPTEFSGVEWKKLRYEPEGGESAVLLRFAPGAQYGAHLHPEGEQYYVLDGTIEDGEVGYAAGSYVYHPPGSRHRPRSAGGCLLFVTLPTPIQLL
jgi:anti-sigma factor ChrR (cupin superfamily)